MNAAVHWRTPTLTVQDGRGLPVRQVEYLHQVSDGTRRALISRQTYNTLGQPVEQWDPRLWDTDAEPNLRNVHRLSGEPLRVQSVDAGWRLSLAGPGGEVRRRWDQRGTQWRTEFDEQLRVISVSEDQAEVERYRYGDATADAGHNLRGQLLEQSDASGTLALDSYSLLGQIMSETRAFSATERYTCRRRYNPVGAVLEQTDAGGHRQLLRYDRASRFKGSRLQLDPQSEPLPIISDSQYDAAGQLLEQRMANGVLNRWHYDPADGRLTQWQAGPDNGPALQDLRYRYDRVGNVVAIDDGLFQPVFFANQRVDANREFSYDSLYRLISGNGFEGDVPQSRPGLPPLITPIDNGRLFNYVQHYAYDDGGNLTTLRHVRDGHNFTRQMRIDPCSNRGVEWTEGDPEPVFERLFDGHGNQLALQPGQPLTWNRRDQLAVARLVERSGGPHDEETYLYSLGQRVSKRLVTQAQTVSHVRQVRYLPGLEIRTLDDHEELHVIQVGSVRCLHWRKGRPAAIEQDQLRFGVDDPLGSSSLELDRQGQVISHERYYPFGGTAWWAAASQVQADYKTIRYSGKEMDVSGLYYYGARYYAPWLQRWVSADPAGDVDGLNLYGFVGNNPLNYIDGDGQIRWPRVADVNAGVDRIIHSENLEYSQTRQDLATSRLRRKLSTQVTRQIEILGITKRRVRDASEQLSAMGSGTDVALAATRRTLVLVAGKAISLGVGIAVGVGAQALGAAAPGVGNAAGVALGFAAKAAVSGLVDYVAERTGLSASVNLKTKKLTAQKIITKAEYKQMEPLEYIKAKYQNMNWDSPTSRLKLSKESATQTSAALLKATLTNMPSEAVSAISSGVGVLLGLPEIVDETIGASRDKSATKMADFESNVLILADQIGSGMTQINEFADALSISSIGGVDLQGLQDETARITGVLQGFAQTIREHSNYRKAA